MGAPNTDFIFDLEPIGSVGSLVAAVLETAGHSMHSAVLDFFEQGFSNDFGILLYLLAAISGLFIYAVGGHYKFGLWFFLGPTLFYALLLPRVPSKGVHWKLGGREFNQIYVERMTEGVTAERLSEKGNKAGDVSWFFALWDEFVSGLVNSFVSLLKLDLSQIDLGFISKTQRYHTLLDLEIQDGSLKSFVNLLMVTRCNAYFGVMKDYYGANQRLNSAEEIRRDFKKTIIDKEGKESRIEKAHPAIQQALKNGILYDYIESPADPTDNSILPQKITDENQLKENYTCEEIWQLGINSLKMHASTLFAAVANANLPPGMTVKDVEDKIREKVDTKVKIYAKPPESPDDTGEYEEVSLDDNQKLLVFINEIAVRMFFRELQKIEKNIIQAEFDQVHPKEFWANDNQSVHDLREAFQGLEYESKGMYLASMLAIPYLQGITLYFLALTYPFFAMAMIWPGRHWAFLRWMALWFWVKSWDIGFAIVMIVDELLYNLMPHGPPVSNSTAGDPAEALKTILEVDPGYTVNTYFNVLATLIGAVPVLTGILVKKGGGEIVHAVAQGYQNFSGKIGFAMEQYHLSLRNQDLAERITKGEIKAFKGAIGASLRDRDVMAALGGELMAKQFLSRLNQAGGRKDILAGIASDIQSGLIQGEGGRYLRDLAKSKFHMNIRRAIYNESQRLENLQIVHDTIINYYSNHDFIITHPLSTEYDYKKAQINYRPGGATGNVMSNAFRKVFKVSPHVGH